PFPIFRPRAAHRIYEISIFPGHDCCSLFAPIGRLFNSERGRRESLTSFQIRRQGTLMTLYGAVARDQLCGGRPRANHSSCWLSERTPHNGNPHKTELLLSLTKEPINRSTHGCDSGT